ncbi:MAG: aminoacyl-tRNA hydrolase [Bacteroidia bacterium]|nr:aminoacyl-tRNA hydrolase [Bacteroidia bacterium]
MTIEQLKISGIEKEINFAFAKSGGKGGQHVNKTESKAELYFNIGESTILPEFSKKIIYEKLKNRINDKGELVLADETSRSQHTNKANVIEKFYELIAAALKQKKKRRPTKPSKSSKAKKKSDKIHHKKIKALRRGDF